MANSTKIMLEAMNNLTVAITKAKSTIELETTTFLDVPDDLDVPESKLESSPILSPSMGETLQSCLNPNKKLEHIIK